MYSTHKSGRKSKGVREFCQGDLGRTNFSQAYIIVPEKTE